jgi:archaellum biogenesis ATPase FlaH
MFANGVGTIFETISSAQKKYDSDIDVNTLLELHRSKYPALPDSSREPIEEVIKELDKYKPSNKIILKDLIIDFWKKDKAHKISDLSADIWLGNSDDFIALRTLVDSAIENTPEEEGNFQEVKDDVQDYINGWDQGFEFRFDLQSLADKVGGVGRGNLGIIFARPETGKTTFCTYLVAEYIRQGFKVAYFANEEPGRLVKGRVFSAYLKRSIDEMKQNIEHSMEVYRNEIEPNLKLLEGRGITLQEIEKFVDIHKPDVVMVDQLDKVVISGNFSRTDEKLRALYESSRAIAKKQQVLLWSVSQASYDAQGRQEVDFSMLENSRTGKAAEADIIIGIGKNYGEEEDYIRHLCVSKNKLNGWHGTVTCSIDIHRARYEL